MNKLFISLLVASSVMGATQAFAQDDNDHGLKLSPSIERVAGLSHVTAKPDNSSSVGATFFNVAGAVHDPLSMPRIGFDVYLPNGFGFGAALGFTTIHLSSESANGNSSRDGGTLSAYLFAPRIAYRIPVNDYFDVVPRLGVSFLGGSVTESGDYGDKSSVHATTISPEVVGIIRITTSFNILTGLSYDHVVSAGTENTDNYSSSSGSGSQTTSRDAPSGTYSSIHLWFGMSGYL